MSQNRWKMQEVLLVDRREFQGSLNFWVMVYGLVVYLAVHFGEPSGIVEFMLFFYVPTAVIQSFIASKIRRMEYPAPRTPTE